MHAGVYIRTLYAYKDIHGYCTHVKNIHGYYARGSTDTASAPRPSPLENVVIFRMSLRT